MMRFLLNAGNGAAAYCAAATGAPRLSRIAMKSSV
jgi:hypothetical protein